MTKATDMAAKVLSSTAFVICCVVIAYGFGSVHGYSKGWKAGRDTVMCVMDRFAHSHGARGRTEYCQRIDAERDARP